MPSVRRKKVLQLPLPPLASTLTPLLAPAPTGGGSRRRGGAGAAGEEGASDRRKSAGGRGKKDALLAAALAAEGGGKGEGQDGAPSGSGSAARTGIASLDEGREPSEQEVLDFYRSRAAGVGSSADPQAQDVQLGQGAAGPSTLDTPNGQDASSKAALSFLLSNANGNTLDAAPPGAGSLNGWSPPAALTNGHAAHTNGVSARAGPSREVKEPEVWWIEQTGEVFMSYEAYISRMMFYRQPIFTCEITGRTDLTFFQALESEREDNVGVHRLFPEALKAPILHAVQFQSDGRLDDLVDKISERMKDRFFMNEKLFVEVDHEKLLCNISAVYEPEETVSRPHETGMDFYLDNEEAVEQDDPASYAYEVELMTMEDMHRPWPVGEGGFSGKRLRVGPDALHRDKTQFHKVMIRKYLRECLTRDVHIGSPWIVRPELAELYGIEQEMSEEVKERIAEARQEVLNKRKKPKVEEEEPEEEPERGAKRQKTGDGKGKKGEKKKPLSKEELRIQQEEEEAQRLEDEKRRKRKPTKFPAEDLLIEPLHRELEAGMLVERPLPTKHLPFAGNFDTFLSTWQFINVMGATLQLSQFTLDEFEQALYHSEPSQPCHLLTETHAALLNVIIREANTPGGVEVFPLKAYGPLGIKHDDDDESKTEHEDEAALLTVDGEPMDPEDEQMLYTAANDAAQAWTAKELSAKDGRKGWETALVGCLWSRSNIKTLPNLLLYCQTILLETDAHNTRSNKPSWAAIATRPRLSKRPDQRYLTLHSTFKLEILAFLVELVTQTKIVRDAFEDSVAALSKCRNDQNEAKREYKRIHDEIEALDPKAPKTDANGAVEAATGGEVDPLAPTGADDIDMPLARPSAPSVIGTATDRDELDESRSSPASDDDMDASETMSDAPSGSGANGKSKGGAAARQKALLERKKQQDAERAARDKALAQQKEEAKQKKAEGKTLTLERKRLADELEVARERLIELDREFRRQHNTLRVGPIGLDRFGNKYWWLDGMGSAQVLDREGNVLYGTGRLFVQGASPEELQRRADEYDFTPEEVQQKRLNAETEEGILADGEWAVYDTPEQLHGLLKWLLPRGSNESKLLKFLRSWWYAIEGGLQKRIKDLGLADSANGDDLPARRARVGRTAAMSHKGKEAYLSYRVGPEAEAAHEDT